MNETVDFRTTSQGIERQLKSLYPAFSTAQDALDKILHAAETVKDETLLVILRKAKPSLIETGRLVDAALEELERLKTAGAQVTEESPPEVEAAGAARTVTQEASAKIAELLNQILNSLMNVHFTGQFLKLITSLGFNNAHPVMKELAKAAPAAGVSMRGLDALSGIEFEGLITQLLKNMGFHAVMTKASGDGGIDIVATLNQPLIGGRCLIQCKRYAPDSPVGASTVREFYGVIIADRCAVKGILITTSSFSMQSREFARALPIELIGRDQLQLLLGQYGLLHPEIPGGHPIAQLVVAGGPILEFIVPCVGLSAGAQIRASWDSIVGRLPSFLRPSPPAGASAPVSANKG